MSSLTPTDNDLPLAPTGPTRLVVASNGDESIVLWGVGAGYHGMLEASGSTFEELGIYDGPPDEGVWVLEGKWVDTSSNRLESDVEFRGNYRKPSTQEWASIKSGNCPWAEEYAA